MEELKKKFPFVEEDILKYYDEKDKVITKELNILNKEREMRIKAEKYKNEATARCMRLQSQLEEALKELNKLKKINDNNDNNNNSDSEYKD
tara:strand:- start:376 stop:648 length:273 start_codon:yes stop_codon:yes gene_type:complete